MKPRIYAPPPIKPQWIPAYGDLPAFPRTRTPFVREKNGLWVPLHCTVALVAGQTASGTGAGTTATATLTNNPTAGNFVIALVASANGAATTCTVQDGAGTPNAYTKTAGSPTFRLGIGSAFVFYLPNAPGTANKAITATASSTSVQIWVAEFSGVATSSPFEREAGDNTHSGATINLPTITTTNNGDLIVACAVAGATITSANSPWTGISIVQNGNYAAYMIQGTAGAQAINFTQNASSTWTAQEAAFKAAAGSTTFIPLVGEGGLGGMRLAGSGGLAG